MGVGFDMFIRAIAALVVALKGIPGNTEPSGRASSTACLLDVLALALTIEACPLRRALKHEEQYTGLP